MIRPSGRFQNLPGNYGTVFPLHDDRYAFLSLPADLTEQDAERLCGAIRALVIPPSDPEEG